MTVQPTEVTIRAVAAAISRAEIHDDRMTSDPNRIRAWADTCAPHGIDDTEIACRAVDEHYTAPGADTLRAGAFIAAYRKLRRDRAEAEKGDLAALPSPDPQFGGLPIGGADGEPVWVAYEQHGAIQLPCATCGAAPEESCVNTGTSKSRKIPCVSRLAEGYRRTNT